jgi:hypothetical protein
MRAAVTLLYGDQPVRVEDALVRDGDLWLRTPELRAATGWEVKPEGVCKGEICVPVSDAQRSAMLQELEGSERFDLSAFARLVEQPVARDERSATWCFGPPGWDWRSRASGRRAPDFTLPDLSGKPHTLSELRGNKVFLLFWASW